MIILSYFNFYTKGYFWSKMELHNFPFDVQEIGIVISSELDGSEIKLISDPQKLSFLNVDPKNLLIDQNRW